MLIQRPRRRKSEILQACYSAIEWANDASGLSPGRQIASAAKSFWGQGISDTSPCITTNSLPLLKQGRLVCGVKGAQKLERRVKELN